MRRLRGRWHREPGRCWALNGGARRKASSRCARRRMDGRQLHRQPTLPNSEVSGGRRSPDGLARRHVVDHALAQRGEERKRGVRNRPRRRRLFQTFSTTTLGFSDLASFTIAGIGYYPTTQFAVDSIVVTEEAVPEPATSATMVLGFVGLGFAGYFRARTSHALRRLNASLAADRLEGMPPAMIGRDLQVCHHLAGEAHQAILCGPPDTANVVTGGGLERRTP
jgi:PEP-CTERM motif